MRCMGRDITDVDIYIAGQERRNNRRSALVRYVRHFNRCRGLEQFQLLDYILERLGRKFQIGGELQRLRGQQADRRKTVEGIVWERRVQRLVHRKREVDGLRKGVAVWRRLGYELCADYAIGSGMVIDENRLSPFLGQLLALKRRQIVHRAARCQGNNDSYRFDRKRLRLRHRSREHCRTWSRRREQQSSKSPFHGASSGGFTVAQSGNNPRK